MIEELLLCGVSTDLKELITKMKKMLLYNECSNPKIDPFEKNLFQPRLLTAID